ncbi:hypothetical protein BRADI_2g31880v3 [Brachypodium distachyon]|uniref:Uncharacterized protein n=1 Tax=Brachypodium distachyon TaxID=15368 RepID=A0A2K2DBF0_BRADI|nr:hypothetical protein BRADI_2g31880v3 [Brachypodium distachyon]
MGDARSRFLRSAKFKPHSLDQTGAKADRPAASQVLAGHLWRRHEYAKMATDAKTEEKGMNVEKRRKTKKTFMVPQHQLDEILGYKVRPVPPSLAEQNPSRAAKIEKLNEIIVAKQEKFRREYEAQGYATFEAEVTDDEQEKEANPSAASSIEEDANPSAASSIEEDANPSAAFSIPQGRRGRRRFPPARES